MKAIRLSRKVHKWFALVLGIQLFLWALSGFYMVAVDIDIIHGDMLVKNMDTNVGSYAQVGIPLERIAGEFPDSSSVTLTAVVDRPAYLVEGPTPRLLDANSGELLSPINKNTATQIATYHYAGDGEVSRVQLIESDPPTELQSRALPLWRVDFDDVWNSSFYVDPNSGQFTTRRHSLWRVFDFLWMLHVMDYDTRSDINNNVLRIFSVFGTLLGLSGVWLLFYSFNRRKVDGIAK
ncbi:MAG TPA: PepSY domain-containing protein [Woeseiaceae bacterium]|nr:PepSY domain-containing protein [Woeseiaceae bacterium]|tara:strand:- start:1543 stop:2250 length:708 start_codon:yes stop_codon:yes gene_type:complete